MFITGFFSWGNSLKGSWFVQALVKVFQEFATTKEIMWMMTRVNQAILDQFESDTSKEFMKKKKHMPSVQSWLTKELYFRDKVV